MERLVNAALCAACGRVIPEQYLTASVEGMHPGCARKLAGVPPINDRSGA